MSLCSESTGLQIRLVRVLATEQASLNKQAHQSGLRPVLRVLLKSYKHCRASPNVFLSIYSANIVVSPAVLPVH